MYDKFIKKCVIGMLSHTFYSLVSRVRQKAETILIAGFSVDVICMNEPGAANEQGLNIVRIHRLHIRKKLGWSLP